MCNFDIDKFIEERKARWAKIEAAEIEVLDPQVIMNMTDEEFERWENQGNGEE